MFTLYVIGLCGVFHLSIALIANASNIQSKIAFKVIPFFIGLFLILYAVKRLGWF
jgi:Na+/H+ antiporter NhaD/arsenite permease-like protein